MAQVVNDVYISKQNLVRDGSCHYWLLEMPFGQEQHSLWGLLTTSAVSTSYRGREEMET